jgi:BolA family transcriptional regulator, general stress-responsive regulator
MNQENPRVKMIEQRLNNALQPSKLRIQDDSAQHAGHAGAIMSGGGHFSVEVVSAAFEGKSAVARHKLIYAALGDAMQTDIHALSIKAFTPQEAKIS